MTRIRWIFICLQCLVSCGFLTDMLPEDRDTAGALWRIWCFVPPPGFSSHVPRIRVTLGDPAKCSSKTGLLCLTPRLPLPHSVAGWLHQVAHSLCALGPSSVKRKCKGPHLNVIPRVKGVNGCVSSARVLQQCWILLLLSATTAVSGEVNFLCRSPFGISRLASRWWDVVCY